MLQEIFLLPSIRKIFKPMKKIHLVFAIAATSAMVIFGSCKKDDDSSTTTTTTSTPEKKYMLVIDNGAQSIDVGKSLAFSAHLVNSSGAIVSAPNVSWSSNIGGMTGSTFKLDNDTSGIVTASVEYEGVTYTAAVPICVQPLNSTQLFDVVPSAIIWSTNAGNIQLNTVYFGTGSANYAFSSLDPSIASVTSGGSISFLKAGNTKIKVTGTINGQTAIFYVPVLVVGVPEVPLPVTRIEVTPALKEMFRGETITLSAKAYNSAGTDVSNTVTFNYVVIPKLEEDEDPNSSTTPTAVTVSSSGVVTAKSVGGAYVKVTAAGLQAQTEIVVNPDYVVMVNPFFTTLGTDMTQFPPTTKTSETFTATTYKVDRNAYHNNKNSNYLTVISNPANLTWDLPLTGIPDIDNLFNVVTLSGKSNTKVTATAIQGKIGSTFVVAHNDTIGGAGSIFVNP